jgi:hypothetical protein
LAITAGRATKRGAASGSRQIQLAPWCSAGLSLGNSLLSADGIRKPILTAHCLVVWWYVPVAELAKKPTEMLA